MFAVLFSAACALWACAHAHHPNTLAHHYKIKLHHRGLNKDQRKIAAVTQRGYLWVTAWISLGDNVDITLSVQPKQRG